MTTPNMGGVQSAPAYQNRNTAMTEGIRGSAGLQADQQAMNSAGPPKVRMTGSGNGMSAGQAQQTMSGMLPTANGQAENTYESKKWFEGRQQ